MIKGIYTASAGLRQKMLAMEVVANNLSNINTTGFKRDDLFASLLHQQGVPPDAANADTSGLQLRRYTDRREGSLEQTNNPFDLAMQGNGYFVLNTPKGLRYTRNGRFQLSTDGTLVNEQGFAVMGKNGPIQLRDSQQLSSSDVVVTERGEVIQKNLVVGQLRIVDFAESAPLQKEDNATFTTSAAPTEVDLDVHHTVIRQGHLEESNVDGIEEMVSMIELSRGFESNQKALQSQDATLERSLDVGRM